MNDSFLTDLEMEMPETMEKWKESVRKNPDRNITQRRSMPSSSEAAATVAEDRLKSMLTKPRTPLEKNKLEREKYEEKKGLVRSVDRKNKCHEVGIRSTPERKLSVERKLQPVENLEKKEKKKKHGTDRWSAESAKESSRFSSEGSSKENTLPSESWREIPKNASGFSRKSSEILEHSILSSVDEIVGAHTKNQGDKVLTAMEQMYWKIQTNIVKLMLKQTDEIVNCANSRKESPKLRALVEENERLKNDMVNMIGQIDEMKKIVEDYELLKLENVELKKRCKSLK